MISPSPSSTAETSSGVDWATRRPIRETARVRIWLILIHERFGRPFALLSMVSGNPARGSRLVSATAITVPERSLNTSWLRTRTGRSPACSLPRIGIRSAQRISPLSIRAKCLGSRQGPPQPTPAPPPDSAFHTPERAGFSRGASASQRPQPRWPGSGSRSGVWKRDDPVHRRP